MNNTPLRLRYPELYILLVQKLTAVGLQPYDVIAAIQDNEAMGKTMLYVQFGAGFGEKVMTEVDPLELVNLTPRIQAFMDTAVDSCREAVIGEYRAAMRLRS